MASSSRKSCVRRTRSIDAAFALHVTRSADDGIALKASKSLHREAAVRAGSGGRQ
jgi:hypothetical protein